LDEVKQLRKGKATGPDEIAPEILAANITTRTKLLNPLILQIPEKKNC
jgi:hypothetical protein